MRLLALAAILILLLGCERSERYEMTKDGRGRTIRLDKKTGEVAVIQDDRIVVLKDQKEFDAEHRKVDNLADPKPWPTIDIPQLGNVKASVTTAWRDEKLLYQFSIWPISSALEAAVKKPLTNPNFIVEFYDDNNFKIAEVRLPLVKMSRMVDEKGSYARKLCMT
jgi:hypothetical protein